MILAVVTPARLWDWSYHPDPGVIDGIVVLTLLYILAVGPARRWLAPQEKFSWLQASSFGLAQLILLFAVASPLDEIAEQYLFSAHMAQHVLLLYPVPLLWLWGIPPWLLRIPFAMEWSAPIARALVRPAVAFVGFNALFYIWHIPGLYEWALRDSKIHFLEHATFMGTSLLLWWPLLQPLPELPRLHPGWKLLYLLGGSIAQMPLLGILVFSQNVFYPTYRNAVRVTELSALSDQQLGAVIMKLSAMVVMFSAMVIIFLRWYYSEEGRRPKARLPQTQPELEKI